MITNILIGLLFIISAIAKSETDTIRFKPLQAWFQSDFWLEKKDVTKRSWLFKYPLACLWGGWHGMDTVRILCLCSIIIIHYGIIWYFAIPLIILLYAIHGIIFEIFYIN
mgnify:CR=1 FL=1